MCIRDRYQRRVHGEEEATPDSHSNRDILRPKERRASRLSIPNPEEEGDFDRQQSFRPGSLAHIDESRHEERIPHGFTMGNIIEAQSPDGRLSMFSPKLGLQKEDYGRPSQQTSSRRREEEDIPEVVRSSAKKLSGIGRTSQRQQQVANSSGMQGHPRPSASRTLDSSDQGKSNLKPGFARFVLDDKNKEFIKPFVFTEEEIRDAFSTLDVHKYNYITAEEIAFFLDVLEENASREEIEEMVRMLDLDGSGKIRYDEFYRFASGQSLAPIGQAYPPSLKMLLEKQKNKEKERVLRQQRQMAKVSQLYTRGEGQRIEKKTSVEEEVDEGEQNDSEPEELKVDQKERKAELTVRLKEIQFNAEKFMRQAERMKEWFEENKAKLNYDDFLRQLQMPEAETTKEIFEFMKPLNSKEDRVDVREAMIILGTCVSLPPNDKLEIAFNLYDFEGEGLIRLENMKAVLRCFNLQCNPKRVLKKFDTIYATKAVEDRNWITRELFYELAREYPDLFFSRL
eukprot:TRINITY_DN1280_c0_g1_i1.p1 TRINITY_DN1280_c0_g1~~TRINITY_DN1280_c0_g1_i1.p1  ORF type:complete len:540 (+),score=163.25 TRINITY_DN1280_c0_g1_i1:89-1621(+)